MLAKYFGVKETAENKCPQIQYNTASVIGTKISG